MISSQETPDSHRILKTMNKARSPNLGSGLLFLVTSSHIGANWNTFRRAFQLR